MSDRKTDERPAWEKPTMTPLGNLAEGHGGGTNQCTEGSSASGQCFAGPAPGSVCGNGSDPHGLSKCFSGSHPESNSCAEGVGGS
jgi:hypothetical protein